MIFDQQSPQAMGEMITSPDWLFGDTPKDPGKVKETEHIKGQGETGSRVIRVKGSSDSNRTYGR